MRPAESLHHFDIKDIGPELPEQKTELHFDPARDLTSDDRRNIRSTLEEYREDKSWASFMMLAADYVALDPDNRVTISGDIRAGAGGMFGIYRREKMWSWMFGAARAIQAFDETFVLHLTNSERKNIHQLVGKLRKENDWLEMAEYIQFVQSFDPTIHDEIQVSDMEAIRGQYAEKRRSGNGVDLARWSVIMHDIDSSIPLDLTDDEWARMKEELDRIRKGVSMSRRRNFAGHAHRLIILASLSKDNAPARNLNDVPLPTVKKY